MMYGVGSGPPVRYDWFVYPTPYIIYPTSLYVYVHKSLFAKAP